MDTNMQPNWLLPLARDLLTIGSAAESSATECVAHGGTSSDALLAGFQAGLRQAFRLVGRPSGPASSARDREVVDDRPVELAGRPEDGDGVSRGRQDPAEVRHHASAQDLLEQVRVADCRARYAQAQLQKARAKRARPRRRYRRSR